MTRHLTTSVMQQRYRKKIDKIKHFFKLKNDNLFLYVNKIKVYQRVALLMDWGAQGGSLEITNSFQMFT